MSTTYEPTVYTATSGFTWVHWHKQGDTPLDAQADIDAAAVGVKGYDVWLTRQSINAHHNKGA